MAFLRARNLQLSPQFSCGVTRHHFESQGIFYEPAIVEHSCIFAQHVKTDADF
jgi:hypothetical protein